MTSILIDMDAVGANKAAKRKVKVRVKYIDSVSQQRKSAELNNELQAYIFLLCSGALILNANTKAPAELEGGIIRGSRPSLNIVTQKTSFSADRARGGIPAVELIGGGAEMHEELLQQVLRRMDRKKVGRFLIADPDKHDSKIK